MDIVKGIFHVTERLDGESSDGIIFLLATIWVVLTAATQGRFKALSALYYQSELGKKTYLIDQSDLRVKP